MSKQNRMRRGKRERGSQLFELALVTPLLLLLTAGVADFAQGWNVRQVLANAARDGARLGMSESYVDLTTSNPNSIQEICQQVADYLIQEHVNPSFMGITGTSSTDVTSACSGPGTVVDSTTGVTTGWTYYTTGTSGNSTINYGLEIQPNVQVPPTGGTCGPSVTCVASTKVTLIYPFNWAMGTNLIGLAKTNPTIAIRVYSVMPNN